MSFLREQGKTIVVATSADEEELDAILRQAGVDDLIQLRTSNDDVGPSKPDPDIVLAALEEAHARPDAAVMIGDTPYDMDAARRAGVGAIALRSGGYWPDRAFGVPLAVFDDPADLLAHWR